MLKKPLEKRGERVVVLNIGNMHANIPGESDGYNPLHVVCDGFEREGGLGDVGANAEEIAKQFTPNPSKAARYDKIRTASP